jgi:predicted nucleic acid-binding protein
MRFELLGAEDTVRKNNEDCVRKEKPFASFNRKASLFLKNVRVYNWELYAVAMQIAYCRHSKKDCNSEGASIETIAVDY